MRTFAIAHCLAAASLVGGATLPQSFRAPTSHELASLRAADETERTGRTSELAMLRAGKGETHAAMDAAERSRLSELQRLSPSLADLRAGDLSNSTLLTI